MHSAALPQDLREPYQEGWLELRISEFAIGLADKAFNGEAAFEMLFNKMED